MLRLVLLAVVASTVGCFWTHSCEPARGVECPGGAQPFSCKVAGTNCSFDSTTVRLEVPIDERVSALEIDVADRRTDAGLAIDPSSMVSVVMDGVPLERVGTRFRVTNQTTRRARLAVSFAAASTAELEVVVIRDSLTCELCAM